jgi:hypothetical protein
LRRYANAHGAAGFAFEGVPPKDDEWARAHPGEMAILATRVLEVAKRADAARARAASITLGYVLPHDAAVLERQSGLKADVPALAHAGLGAVKIGVSDAAGSRIAGPPAGRLAAPRGIPGCRRCGRRATAPTRSQTP